MEPLISPSFSRGEEHLMDRLRVAVLGSPEVVHAGRRLTFALRKAQALLLYLAVEGGLHPRSKLAALLWPDSEPITARRALCNALVLLHDLLADASPVAHRHLLSSRELVGLNPQAPLELDLDVVQQAYNEARRFSTLPAEPQRTSLLTQWHHTLSLARGPFLDGFWLGKDAPFDEWVLQQQQQWQLRLQLLLDRLSCWHEQAREWEQAIDILGRWLALGGGVSPPHATALGPRRSDGGLAGLRHLPGTAGPGVTGRALSRHRRPGGPHSRHRSCSPRASPCPSLPCHHGAEPTA
jgi:DNA-binding SARP family transcriptional activator